MTGKTPNLSSVAQLNLWSPRRQLDLGRGALLRSTAVHSRQKGASLLLAIADFHLIGCCWKHYLCRLCLAVCVLHISCSMSAPREHTVIKGISVFLKDSVTGSDSDCHQGLNLWPTLMCKCPNAHVGEFPTHTGSHFPPSFPPSETQQLLLFCSSCLFLYIDLNTWHTPTHPNREHQLDTRLSVFVNFSSAFFS